jgi:hypothetical protein
MRVEAWQSERPCYCSIRCRHFRHGCRYRRPPCACSDFLARTVSSSAVERMDPSARGRKRILECHEGHVTVCSDSRSGMSNRDSGRLSGPDCRTTHMMRTLPVLSDGLERTRSTRRETELKCRCAKDVSRGIDLMRLVGRVSMHCVARMAPLRRANLMIAEVAVSNSRHCRALMDQNY